MRWSQATEVGLVRKQNEDSICLLPELSFFAVADGMGGHMAGEVASKMAIDFLVEKLKDLSNLDSASILAQAVRQSNERVYSFSMQEGIHRGMGTTLTAAMIRKDKLILAHVGDSRAYLVRGDNIIPLTEDHSLVQEMLRSGGITTEQAKKHPRRNILTRALGVEESVTVDLKEIPLELGDILILCTDGLYNLVSDKSIYNIVISADEFESIAEYLADEALKAGGNDNISVIVVKYDG
ncbi:MAG: Stp1/IreP family PP2C-type Ser/Thr phosphatase [Peptococcaceae bacterium]|nr:Stp1/IreP family PP2C-type Ser/Thr phosphatase [Peptococcaceae bacterium]